MNDFLNWEQINKMHSLGYDGKTLMYIDDEEDIINDDSTELIGAKPAILTSAAFRWFREKYGLWFRPDYYDEMKEYNFQGSIHELGKYSAVADIGNHKTPEEAELACLSKLIEIVESKKE